MTKEEIQALINAKIAGQGSAIDIGGALPAILNGILELATQGGGGGSTKHVLSIESVTPGSAESYTDALARIKYDGAALTLAQLPTIDWPNTIIVDATGDWTGWQFAITEFAGWENGTQIVGGSWKDDEFGLLVMIQIVDEPGETISSVKFYSL